MYLFNTTVNGPSGEFGERFLSSAVPAALPFTQLNPDQVLRVGNGYLGASTSLSNTGGGRIPASIYQNRKGLQCDLYKIDSPSDIRAAVEIYGPDQVHLLLHELNGTALPLMACGALPVRVYSAGLSTFLSMYVRSYRGMVKPFISLIDNGNEYADRELYNDPVMFVQCFDTTSLVFQFDYLTVATFNAPLEALSARWTARYASLMGTAQTRRSEFEDADHKAVNATVVSLILAGFGGLEGIANFTISRAASGSSPLLGAITRLIDPVGSLDVSSAPVEDFLTPVVFTDLPLISEFPMDDLDFSAAQSDPVGAFPGFGDYPAFDPSFDLNFNGSVVDQGETLFGTGTDAIADPYAMSEAAVPYIESTAFDYSGDGESVDYGSTEYSTPDVDGVGLSPAQLLTGGLQVATQAGSRPRAPNSVLQTSRTPQSYTNRGARTNQTNGSIVDTFNNVSRGIRSFARDAAETVRAVRGEGAALEKDLRNINNPSKSQVQRQNQTQKDTPALSTATIALIAVGAFLVLK